MPTLKGLVSILLLTLNTLFWGVPLIILTLIKLITPGRPLRRLVLRGLNGVALNWIGLNLWWMRHGLKPRLDLEIPEGLSRDRWWLVVSNHRGWTDICVPFVPLHQAISLQPIVFTRHFC